MAAAGASPENESLVRRVRYVEGGALCEPLLEDSRRSLGTCFGRWCHWYCRRFGGVVMWLSISAISDRAAIADGTRIDIWLTRLRRAVHATSVHACDCLLRTQTQLCTRVFGLLQHSYACVLWVVSCSSS